MLFPQLLLVVVLLPEVPREDVLLVVGVHLHPRLGLGRGQKRAVEQHWASKEKIQGGRGK